METVYYLTKENTIVTNFDISEAFLICRGIKINPHPENIDGKMYGLAGIKTKLDNPSVELFLRFGEKVKAVKFYKDSHEGISFKEAKEYVDKIENKMEREKLISKKPTNKK